MREDHPRSRGVYAGREILSGERSGSSPLARGLLITFCDGCTRGGIIPARAGFTKPSCHSSTLPRDHPRSRGVYPRNHPKTRGTYGSSPLARGLLGAHLERYPEDGIIPARAGFT